MDWEKELSELAQESACTFLEKLDALEEKHDDRGMLIKIIIGLPDGREFELSVRKGEECGQE